MTYKPYIPGQNSSVTLYLPPAFGLSAIPPNTDDYTVTTATVPLPERYYDEADSDILKGYNSSVTKVTAVTFHYNASVNGQSITTLPIRVNQYSNLSALMVAYGADAANIPLKIIAEAQDEAGNVLDWDILAGTSRITNADGSAEYHSELILGAANSTLDFTSGNYNIQNPTINSSSTYVYNLYEWHYPVTDLVMYLPWPEDVTLKNNPYYSLAAPLDAVYLDTDGDGVPDKRYLKTTTRQLPLINTNYSQYFQASAVLPDQDTLYPGDVFAFGDVFVDYTFLGQTYQQVKMTKLGNHIVRAYKEASFTFGFWNEGWYVDLPSARRRLQGKAGDRYLIGLNNYQSTNPTYVYEDATVTLDFPYEVSPTAISQTAGSGVSGNNGPNAVTYFVHGDSTEYTLPITQGQLQFQFPDNAEHITKVKFHYDVIESASSMNYLIVANNSTTDEQNIALPEEQPVIFNASLTTANGLRTALWEGLDAEKTSNLRDPIYSAFTCESSQRFTLIGLPDALRFGTGLKSPSYSDGNYRTHIAARGQTDGHYNISSYVTPWNIALMKSDSQMKDYQDVTITIAPVGAEDAKALSKLRGFTIPLIPGTHVDQRVLTFATNKHPGGRTVTGNHTGTWVGLELDVDEYVTGPVQLSLGTLYGSSMNATTEVSFGKTSSASGEVWSSWTNDYSIVPAFNGSRYYFDEGVPNSTPVSSSDVHKLVATINTSSVAKFINGTQAPTNSTSTGTITYDTQWSTTIYNSANATVTSWNNTARQYYQGGTISFSVNNNVQAVDQILYAAASGTVSSYPFNHANLLLYLEVAPDFTLQNVSNHQLMEIRPLANGNKLYVYKRNTFSGAYGYAVAYGSFTVQAYVHPDAQLNTVGTPVIVNAGFSWDGFANENMMPSTGTDAYYNRVPHYNLSISERAFPSAWGIADAPQFNDLYGGVENQLAFAIDTNVKIQLALQDKVIIRPVVDGVMYVSQGQFYDHNKTNLAARAYLSNTAIADLPEYEAVFVLPREGGTTTGVNTEGGMYDYPDEFNLYLTGPVQFNGAPDNLNITYWDANGQQVAVSQTSSEAELRSVVEIRVYFKNFAPLDTYSMEFPLETDYVKRGTQTQDLASYIGVKRRYAESPNVSIDTVDFQYSVPAKFVFASYDLTSYVRLDMAETGYANSALSGVATVTVFYRDGAAAEQTLYTSSSGYMHSLKVNADVTRITATIHPDQTTKYGFTIQNAAGVSETYDSDLPRVQPNEVSSLDVDLEDLILKRADRYNVGLYRLPGVTGSHHVVRMGDTAQAVATVSGSASASVLAQYQNVFLPDSTDDSVATITAAGVITGVAVGTTTYTVKTTNTIGQNPVYAFASDTTTGTGTIHVVPNMEVAVRLFYDSNFNGVYDAGEVVVTDPDVYLANANTTTRLVDGGTSAGDGYTYMDVPDATSYYIHAINPGSTNILDADAHRFADAIGLLDGQGDALGYSPAQSGYGRAYQHYDFANYLNNFNDPDFDRSNMTVYMDFALQAPHTVTFTAEHGNVSGGTLTAAAEANGFVAVGGSVVQQDPANRTFLQQKYWHGAPLVSTPANPNVQQYLDSAAEVTPDTHYAWSAARDGRDWKHAQQDEIRTEEQWWSLGTRVLSDMTLIALPKQSSFQVTYQPNLDAATGSVTDDHRYAYNDEVTVKQNEFAHPHYSFTGWNMQQDGSGALYQENDTFNITADTVLYAMWNPQYRIEHYLQRSDGSSYEIKPDATQLLYAPVGSTVTATPLAFAGYLYNAAISTESGMVVDVQGDAGTGITQLVLKLYYDAQPELSIQKTTQQKVVRAEDGIVYTVVVSNTGKGDAKNVRVDEVYPAYIDIATFTPVHGYMDTDTWVIDSIAAGETAMLNVVITLKNDVPDGEMIVNKVLISEVDGKKPTEEISDTEESIVANPKLTIEKTTTQSTVGAGEDINYTITLTNQGTGEARQIIVQEIIPGNATFKTSATSHGTYDEVTHQWRAGTLAAGQSASLSITLTVHADAQDGHRVHNVVEIAKENGTKPDEPPKADAITTVQNPMVLIQKTALQSSVRAGDEITYEIKVTNPRTTEILDVKVQEVLPANVTLQRYMAHQGTYTPANHYWQVGALAANGGSATLTLVVKVDPNAADGNITNQASITEFHPADGVIQQGGPSDTATVLIRNPQLQIEKSSPVPNGSILSSQGGLLYYQIDVRNTGLGKAQHVAVSDAIPANTTLASASSSVPAQITTSATSVRFEIDEIAPGQVVTLSMAVNVSAWEKIGTRTISNTAVLHFQGESVQSNTVVHRQTNTRQVDVPKMGDANQETHLVIMMVMLLAAAVLLRTASYLVRAKAQRDQENKR
ncbi:MAG: hypothetical protein VB041_04390 [Candidatus Limiplasma sp.]|nr:hypothetical protein [Candidatus Limiplasma sp.]